MSERVHNTELMEQQVIAATEYLKLGYRPIPLVAGTKQAALPWKEFQTRYPTVDEIRANFGNRMRGLGLCTGINVAVVDVDAVDSALTDAVIEHCGDTPMKSRTPSGGTHLWYRMRKGVTYGGAVRINDQPLDLRCEGHYATEAWSQSADGTPYEWLGPVLPVSDLPLLKVSWLRERSPKRSVKPIENPSEDVERMIRRARAYMARAEGAVSHQRGHDKTFRMCFVLLEKFGLPESIAWQLLEEFNEMCEPPWKVESLQHKFRDALRIVMGRKH